MRAGTKGPRKEAPMKGVTSVDRAVKHLDKILSIGRLKPSLRRELVEMRTELIQICDEARRAKRFNVVVLVLQLASLINRAAQLLDAVHKYIQ